MLRLVGEQHGGCRVCSNAGMQIGLQEGGRRFGSDTIDSDWVVKLDAYWVTMRARYGNTTIYVNCVMTRDID